MNIPINDIRAREMTDMLQSSTSNFAKDSLPSPFMPDYDLSRLSARHFEQLVQALGLRILGPGTVIFGDGPDGGREATFGGTVPYPNQASPWNGYIVVQAKFKQRLEGTKKDGEWAVRQLKDELQKFASRKKGLRKPEFYLFCTNVVLTPKHGSGSKDRIASVFTESLKFLPLRGYDVWDYDKLRVFLDNYSDIRLAYAAWITPGDVLANVISIISKLKPDFQKNISAFLQKELLADEYVNLDQAGHSSEEQIPMARFFVDLFATAQPVSELVREEKEERTQSQKGFVHEILDAGAHRLSEDPISRQRDSSSVPAGSPDNTELGRFVLVGGPGQGKSTIAQYLCQVYRVALLADGHKPLSHECVNAVHLIQKHCKAEELPSPRARRFPVRVVLSDFAKELASDRPDAPKSLLAYIAHRIRHRTNSALSADDLKEWIANYPWFLVLDGLDEVPASSNRNQVLTAITEFWVDVATSRGDLLVLATTRPQGYSRDFSPDFYIHRYLSPLSVKDALRYAERLTEARFGHDVERRRRVMERLNTASTVEATARLMTSPLQVTIMATLVDRAGQPPPERWRLFSEYYDVIYKREMERDNPAARILRNYKTNIDGIHQMAGLELQTEGERTGRTDARLSREDFGSIVKLRLASEGYSGPELEDLCRNITDTATQRLVFLVGAESDRVGFEIRSLQEFMAAEALMEGTDGEISERLKAIAPITYCRNVFLFAAGKCFAHRQHLRDVVLSVCENLNEESDLDHRALTGSELALDLLGDGTARQHPKFQIRLTRLACRLVARPCGTVHQVLSDSYYDSIDSVFREEIPKGFPTGVAVDQSGAICTPAWLAIKGVAWATQLADSNWPQPSDLQLSILKKLTTTPGHPWLNKKVIDFLSATSEFPRSMTDIQKVAPPPWNKALGLVFGETDFLKSIALQVPPSTLRTFYFRFSSCKDPMPGQSLEGFPSKNAVWESLRHCAEFFVNPTKVELAAWLNALAERDDWTSVQNFSWPWPFRTCLSAADSQDSLRTFAEQATSGKLGDQEDWLAAEARWAGGITPDDIIAFDQNRGMIGTYLRERGFPVDSGASAVESSELRTVIEAFLDALKVLKQPAIRSLISAYVLFAAALLSRKMTVSQTFNLDLETVLALAREAGADESQPVNLDGVIAFSAGRRTADWISAFDEIGRLRNISVWGPSSERNQFSSNILESFIADTSRRGLARILGRFARGIADQKIDWEPPQLPSTLLKKLDWADSPYRANLIFLQLANPGLSLNETNDLVQKIAALTEVNEDLIATCLRITRRCVPLPVQEKLALELCDALPSSAWGARSAAFDFIDDLLRLHRSPLGDPAVRAKLRLPGFIP